MDSFNAYVFVLCLIVFILIAGLGAVMLTSIVKMYLKAVRSGIEDEELKAEYIEEYKKSKKVKVLGNVLTLIIGLVFISIMAFSIFLTVQNDRYYENVPTLKMVNSGSMSKKHPKNTYLDKNSLDNQFQTFDLVLVYKAPAEKDLKVYDVILYEVDGVDIIHRIIAIEEPMEGHPNQRYFLCKGDANETPDRFPVYYSQIKGIYKGERVPFVGSFITFLQSPAGWLCVALVLVGTFGTPFLEKKLRKEKLARLKEINFIAFEGNVEGRSLAGESEEVEKDNNLDRGNSPLSIENPENSLTPNEEKGGEDK